MWEKNTVVFAIILALSTSVAAQENDESAHELFNTGIQLFESGEYDQAAAVFEETYKIKPSWKIRYNIGQAYAASKKYGLALDNFEQYLAKGGDEIKQERIAEVISEVDRLRKMVGAVSVEAPDGTELHIDGALRGVLPLSGNLRVAMGEHRFVLMKENDVFLDKNFVITGSMVTEIVLKDKSDAHASTQNQTTNKTEKKTAAHPAGSPPSNSDDKARKQKLFLVGGIATGALGVVGIGIGTAFTIKGAKDFEKLDSARADYLASNQTSTDAYSRAKKADDHLTTDKKMMVVGFVSGGVFAAASAVLFIMWKKNKKKPLALRPAMGGIQVNF